MPRSRSIPAYRYHKSSGQAIVTLRDNRGVRRDVYLGEYDSQQSHQEYARIVAELAVNPKLSPPRRNGALLSDLTVNEVLEAYVEHADQHYRGPDGRSTGEVEHVKMVCRHVRQLYAHTLATDFGPLALKAVRQRFINQGWLRKSINQQIERVRRAFKWAAGEELIPFEVYHRLTAVTGLQFGRTSAQESVPVGPIEDAKVDAVLPFLNRHVRGLVEFQRLTGCRPGEACSIRQCNVDTSGGVWLYRPTQHKGSWQGKTRVIAVGPKAQTLLKEFFAASLDDYLFSPHRAVEEVRAARATARKTPRYPSHMKRNSAKRKAKPQRTPAERYHRTSYRNALARACDLAFPPEGELKQRSHETARKWRDRLTASQWKEVIAWRKSHHWHPNQLRHTFATRIRREHGLEAAQVLLGHSKADVTQIYAERNEALAVDIAAKIG